MRMSCLYSRAIVDRITGLDYFLRIRKLKYETNFFVKLLFLLFGSEFLEVL